MLNLEPYIDNKLSLQSSTMIRTNFSLYFNLCHLPKYLSKTMQTQSHAKHQIQTHCKIHIKHKHFIEIKKNHRKKNPKLITLTLISFMSKFLCIKHNSKTSTDIICITKRISDMYKTWPDKDFHGRIQILLLWFSEPENG